MTIFWIVLGVIAVVLIGFGLAVGVSYLRIANAWAWQPKPIFILKLKEKFGAKN